MRARGLLSTTIVASGALMLGCSSGPSAQTTADLARAQTLITQAQASGAQQYAGADLQSARDKVQQAGELAKRDSRRAGMLANEGAADAQLASARAQSAKAQHALDDLNRSQQTLREETERNANEAGAAPPANGPNAPPPANGPDAPPPTSPRD
jgi:Domain of unknown function (DUF4398)